MARMKILGKSKISLVMLSAIALTLIIFLAIYFYQLRLINIYIDINNYCQWSNGRITTETLAIQRIETIKIHRYQLKSRLKAAESNQECLSTTFKGSY